MINSQRPKEQSSILGKLVPRAWLSRNLVSREQWTPYPRINDRPAWDALPSAMRKVTLRHGIEQMKRSWPALSAASYLEYARVGNRSRFETLWFERRHTLSALILAECVENKGRFRDAIADAIWSICEESSWCFPAHIGAQKAGVGLPDTAEPIVDLFAAETGSLLAWSHYLLARALDPVSPLLLLRLEREIIQRILAPCLERDDFWWMGLTGNRVNNWNPWINSNWLSCALLIEPDSRRRVQAVEKIIRSLACFTDPYPDDGGCDEGPSYWTRAGASMFDCLDLLFRATQGKLDIFSHPKVCEIGRFIYRAHIADQWFLNFADAPAIMKPPSGLVFRFGRRIGDEAMQSFARHFRSSSKAASPAGAGSMLRILPDLFDADGLARGPASPPLPRDIWLPDTQVMVSRTTGGKTKGFTLAAKGGHNQESHNHNDVGHFVVFRDGLPVLVDAGVETYTRKTFSPERYSLWTMQSAYHNLPTVNGVMQQDGQQYMATHLSHQATEKTTHFSLDIAAAYPPEAGLVSWIRELHLDRHTGVLLEDRVVSRQAPDPLVWSFITPCRPVLTATGIRLMRRALPGKRITGTAWMAYDHARLEAYVEKITIRDNRLKAIWGGSLFRILLRARKPENESSYRFEILPAAKIETR